MSWLLRSLLKHTTARVCSRGVGVELWTREDTLLTTAERHFERLSLRLAMSRESSGSRVERDAYFFALASLARARRSALTRAIALANDRLTSPSRRSFQ